MKKNYFVLPLVITPCLVQNAVAQEKGEQRPNVVFIYADDIGFGDFSCNGANTIHTPNVDRAAAQGVRFTNAHSAAATSTPSRYAMLTGEYAWRKAGTGCRFYYSSGSLYYAGYVQASRLYYCCSR